MRSSSKKETETKLKGKIMAEVDVKLNGYSEVTLDGHTDISVDEFIRACNGDEREELRDAILDYYESELINRDTPIGEMVADVLLTRQSENTVEARAFIEGVVQKLAERVRDRDFTTFCYSRVSP